MALSTDPIDTHGHTVADAIAAVGDADLALGAEVTLQTSAAADDIIDAAGHGLVEGDAFQFTSKTGGTGVTVGQTYYVIATNLAADTLQFSATPGGAAVNFTTDITAGKIAPLAVASAGLTAVQGDMYLAQSAAEVNAQLG